MYRIMLPTYNDLQHLYLTTGIVKRKKLQSICRARVRSIVSLTLYCHKRIRGNSKALRIMRNDVEQQTNSDKKSFAAIFSRFNIDVNEFVNYDKFRELCIRIFGVDEVNEHEWRVRDIFDVFDVKANCALNEQNSRRCYEWIRAIVNPVNVLIVVDVQNDFIDGTLALRKCDYGQDGAEVVEPINRLLKDGHWNKVIYTQDWHPEDHISFFENLSMRELDSKSKTTEEMLKPFDTVVFSQSRVTQVLWPKHCVANTWGAELHKNLLILPSSELIYKGQHSDKESYSAFDEKDTNGVSEIERILSTIGATHLYICGLAYDVCVKETCLHSLQLGYTVALVDDCCRGVKPDDVTISKNVIVANGGLIASSDRVLSLVNKGKQSLVMAHYVAKHISSEK